MRANLLLFSSLMIFAGLGLWKYSVNMKPLVKIPAPPAAAAPAVATKPAAPAVPGWTVPAESCAFGGKTWPEDMVVHGVAGHSSGGGTLDFSIDGSETVTKIDVAVNSQKPVALVLGNRGSTIWNIGWTKDKTKILAVYVSGFNRQVVHGLPDTVPVVTSTSRGQCGAQYFYEADKNAAMIDITQRLFNRPLEQIYQASGSSVLVGDPPAAGEEMITNHDRELETYALPLTNSTQRMQDVVNQAKNNARSGAPAPQTRAWKSPSERCKFANSPFPPDAVVLVAGGDYGNLANIDVVVNSKKPVLLLLGNNAPSTWRLGWTKKTKILAVLVQGRYTQKVAGIPKNIPVIVSSPEFQSPCGSVKIKPHKMAWVNEMSNKAFGRDVSTAYSIQQGKVVMGDPLPLGEKVLTASGK